MTIADVEKTVAALAYEWSQALVYAKGMTRTSAKIEEVAVTGYDSSAIFNGVYVVEGDSDVASSYFRARYPAV